MSDRRVLAAVVALSVMLAAGSACSPSGKEARAHQPTTGAPDPGWTVQSVPMPDLSRLPQSVQTQVRDRYTALAARSASTQMPSEELAQAHGDVGLILMATGYHAAAETSLRNAQALAPRDAKWPYYLGQLLPDHQRSREHFEIVRTSARTPPEGSADDRSARRGLSRSREKRGGRAAVPKGARHRPALRGGLRRAGPRRPGTGRPGACGGVLWSRP